MVISTSIKRPASIKRLQPPFGHHNKGYPIAVTFIKRPPIQEELVWLYYLKI